MVGTSTKVLRTLTRALTNPRLAYCTMWYFPLMPWPVPRRRSGDTHSPEERFGD